MIVNGEVYRSFQQQVVGTKPTIVDVGVGIQKARVLRRRLLADGTMNSSLYARWISLDLHSDGAGAFGLYVADLRKQGEEALAAADGPPGLIDDESIAFAILSGLLYLAQYAQDKAAAGGTALVRAALVPNKPIEIGDRRAFTESRSTHTLSMAPPAAEAAAQLDKLAEPGPALVATAALLLDELGQAFGIPEMGQLTRAGQIRRRYWSTGWEKQLTEWAVQHGVEIIDEVVL